jgi:hypothetical protein
MPLGGFVGNTQISTTFLERFAMSKVKGLWSVVAAASVGMSVAGVAEAQTTCRRSIGPCVIVGDITGPSSWGSANGMAAFSLGTYSCNVGNVAVPWFQNTTQHPVVGQNLFKLKTVTVGSASYKTFDQIGQSWLKHTFFALSNNLCCTGCQGFPNGDHLGIACSDPYTSSRNGSQSGLGPKWQVNAHTGAFSYPFASPAFQNSATVARRLIVLTTDLENTSPTVAYFCDAQYVSPDCAAVGNQNAATSYRSCNMSGTSMTLTGSTVREQPAIYAWRANDPTMSLVTVDVNAASGTPTERFYVGSAATDLGNGMWHYQYAVYNQNSDQSGGGFSVPLPDTATVANVNFHGVVYRDGDGINNVNFDSAPWGMVRSNNTISWSTTPFATNANANALRWGTMYSFSFDANVAPNNNGSMSLTTFKDVSTYPVAGQVPGVSTGTCYANCDGSTTQPVLNVNDFLCFQAAFAAGDSYANCDNSTTPPVLNVNDFLCFQAAFAQGCP